MAKIQLQSVESVDGQRMMACWEQVLGGACNVWCGTFFYYLDRAVGKYTRYPTKST